MKNLKVITSEAEAVDPGYVAVFYNKADEKVHYFDHSVEKPA